MKIVTSLILSIVLLVTTITPIFAATEESPYLEDAYQINFTDIDLSISHDGKLEIVANESLSRAQSNAAEEKISKLLSAIEEFPSIEADMIAMMEETGNSLCAISITEAPLTWVDDHYERIPSNARNQTSSESSPQGKLSMYTIIGVSGFEAPYSYLAWTCGSWSANSFLGGSNYPAKGVDFVLQTTPNTFSRYEDSLTVTYNYSPVDGVEGQEFWCENGDEHYIRYALEDDPSGIRQCKSFRLSTRSYAPLSNGEYRYINSYYIHTWEQQTLSVSVSASQESGVGLELTPGKAEKSWQLYNYVVFDF